MGNIKRLTARTVALIVLGACGFATSLVFAGAVFATDTTITTTTETTAPQGCTPGYWKNHVESWAPTGYSPSQRLDTVFSPAGLDSLGSASLLDALSFKGGSTVTAAKQIMLRAAVASVLSAAHPGIHFGPSAAVVIGAANFGLRSGIREGILDMGAQFDALNNAGCPLN